MPFVRIYSVLLNPVAKSADLFDALNEVNCRMILAKAIWTGDQVLVETEHPGMTFDPDAFIHGCQAVAAATDRFGPDLAQRFQLPNAFDRSKSEDYQGPYPGYI